MRKFLPYFIIFTVTAALFFWLQSSPTLGDGDSFYHAKMAELIIQHKWPVKNFPWLPFTTLKDNYTDHHLLFHVFLIPFVIAAKNPLIGIKIATVVLAAIFFVLFYELLKKWKIKFAFIWAILPLTTYIIPFRFALAKAPAASLIALFVGLYALLEKRKVLLFCLSFIYVWLHGGWPIILVATFFYCLAETIKNITDVPLQLPQKIQNLKLKIGDAGLNQNYIFLFSRLCFSYLTFYFAIIAREFFKRKNLAPLLICILGLAAGIIINPYFPHNLKFYWVQIVKVAIVNYQSKISVGAEWYPYDTFDLFRENLLVCLLWLFSFAWFLVSFYKPKNLPASLQPLEKQVGQSKESLFLFLFSTFLFIYSIKARRMSEYFIPLAVLSAAFIFNKSLSTADWRGYWQNIKTFVANPKFLVLNIFLILIFVAGLGTLIGSEVQLYLRMRSYFVEARPFNNFREVSEFLKANAAPKTVVFHSCWTYFPMLFYHNDQNYYITGLDATFFYDQNPKLYKIWADIVSGQDKENMAQKIKNNFNSPYVLAEKLKTPIKEGQISFKAQFIENLDADNRFQKIYEDDEAKIYKIVNP